MEKRRGISIITVFFIMVVLVMVVGIIINIKNIKEDDEVEYIENSISSLRGPVQKTFNKNITKEIYGGNLLINCVAKYYIKGRVVNIEKYPFVNDFDKLFPVDFGLSWGVIASSKNNKKINWNSNNDRFLTWRVNDGIWLNKIGGKEAVILNSSNNHIMPANNRVYEKLKKIKVGDFVKIKGYLINGKFHNIDGSSVGWKTSTSRLDTGWGACEFIYVEDISKLSIKNLND